jgi:hypothetical protein
MSRSLPRIPHWTVKRGRELRLHILAKRSLDGFGQLADTVFLGKRALEHVDDGREQSTKRATEQNEGIVEDRYLYLARDHQGAPEAFRTL